MKKHITLSCCLAATIACHQAAAQTTINGPGTAGHNTLSPAATHYVGWDNLTNIDLQIRHDADRPITFHAGINSGNPSSTERMRITPGNDFVGIGLTAPQNLLHLNTYDNYSAVYSQWTTLLNFYPGQLPQATDGLRIGITPVANSNAYLGLLPFAEINQQEDAPMVFFTNNRERMRMMGSTNYFGSNSNAGYVGIGGIDNPRSLMHLSRGGGNLAGGC